MSVYCVPISPALALAVREVRYHGVSALTFLVWQAFLTFDEEVRCIWPMRNDNTFKWTYFYLRYGVIIAHVIHNYFMEELANGTNPPKLCDTWGTYNIVFTQSLSTLLELVLAFRIFALYNRSRKIGIVLLILIVAEVGTGVRMVCMRYATIKYYGPCLLILNKGAEEQCILSIIIHCMLIGLTIFKYIVGIRRGWGRSPLVSLVVRDASTVYATMFFMLISVLLIFKLEKEQGVAVFFWITALMSNSGCYLVVSMERLARKEKSIAMGSCHEMAITSEFSIGMHGSNSRMDRSSIRDESGVPSFSAST